MAENRRVRIEDDIENYLKTHAERVLGKNPEGLTAADYSTLTNRLLYEHKLAQGLAVQFPLGRLIEWLAHILPAASSNITLFPQQKTSSLSQVEEPEDFSFDAALGDLYEEEAA